MTRNGVVVLVRDADRRRDARLLGHGAPRSRDVAGATTLQDNVPPSYAIYMFDPKAQTFLIVAAPPPGFMNIAPGRDPAAHRAERDRSRPPSTPTLAAQNLGLLDVRSVYDTDGLGRMGDGVLAAADLPAGCTHGDRQDGADRSGRHALAGRRPGEDEGPGRRRLQLRAGPLHPRRARGRAAGQA